MPDIVLSLVHGTGARGAYWTTPTGTFAEELAKLLAPHVIAVVPPPQWSGNNRVLDRVIAGEMLRTHIADVSTMYPEACHFVIAHSHGGNAAMYALRTPEARLGAKGLICLSTPFLIFRPRELRSDVAHLLPFAIVAVPMLLAILVSWATGFDLNSEHTKTIVVCVGVGGLIAAQYGYPWITRRFFARLPALKATAIHAWCAENLTYPSSAEMPVMILRASGDEASGALSAARMLSWAIQKVYHAFGAVPRFVEGLWGIFAGILEPRWSVRNVVLGFTYVIALAAVGYASVTDLLSDTVGMMLLMGMLLPFVLVGLLSLLIIPLAGMLVCLIPVMAVSQMAFGWEAALWSPVCEVTTEASPPGEYRVVQLPSIGGGGAYRGPSEGELWHSEPYKDPRAIKVMADWIQEMVAKAGPVSRRRAAEPARRPADFEEQL